MKKNILFIIISCLILNNSIVMGAVSLEMNTSSPIIESAVFQLDFLLELPFMLTSSILNDANLTTTIKQPVKKAEKSKESNTKKDSFLFFNNSETNTKYSGRTETCKKADNSIIPALIGKETQNNIYKQRGSISWHWIFLILLAYFILLSKKGSLPWKLDYSIAV